MIGLHLGNCLEVMKSIPDKSIDMILTDPPYGTTACKWDTVIPFEPMWNELKRITKDNGAICLFGSEPFSSALRISNVKMFKYDWIWEKGKSSTFVHAKTIPHCTHELISVFFQKKSFYYPQMIKVIGKIRDRRNEVSYKNGKNTLDGAKIISNGKREYSKNYDPSLKYPKRIIEFKHALYGDKRLHPTQKPVTLLEYLVKTYTLKNETVLDFTMGSGSTGVACKNLNRKFIGIEKEEKYFNIAKERINQIS